MHSDIDWEIITLLFIHYSIDITITPNILQFTDVLLDLPRINLFLYKRSVGHERTFVCMSMLSNVYLSMRAFERSASDFDFVIQDRWCMYTLNDVCYISKRSNNHFFIL